jgi:hypothetical protein
MSNIIIITSIINISKNPLSYTNIRSIYTPYERFEQTKITISSIRKYIPHSIILLVECSDISNDIENYFKDNVDFFLNLYNDSTVRFCSTSQSKSLGEGMMTIKALEYINNNNIKYNNLIKISGRYWLNNNFIFEYFNNDNIVVKKSYDSKNTSISTCLYKLPFKILNLFYIFLKENIISMKNCIGYEILFADFLNNIIKEQYVIDYIDLIGVSGHISVDGILYNC